MGRTGDSVERTGGAMEAEPRPAGRENAEFSGGGFGEADARAKLSVRIFVERNCAAHDLAQRADRDGVEHGAGKIEKLRMGTRPNQCSLVARGQLRSLRNLR